MANDSMPVGKSTPATDDDLLPILGQPHQLPPCLGRLREARVPDGQRNQAMFNFGVYLRKAYPDNWEERLMKVNEQLCHPQLENRDMAPLIRSLGATKYQYMCNQEPIRSLCNRSECVSLPFGVNHMPWQEKGSVAEFIPSNLRKIGMDPPRYRLDVNGTTVELSSQEIGSFSKLRQRVREVLDIVLPRLREEKWEKQLHDLLQSVEIIDAPDDASHKGAIMTHVKDFLSKAQNGREEEDILRGTPIVREGFILFRAQDLQRFLRGTRHSFVDSGELFTILHGQGARFEKTKIKGKDVQVWMFPTHAKPEPEICPELEISSCEEL